MGLGGIYKFKGSVATYTDLPSTGVSSGWVYNVVDTGKNYAYTPDGTWDDLGGNMDLSLYSLKADTVKEIVGSSAVLNITMGDGTTSSITVNNVANATHASTADSATTLAPAHTINGVSFNGSEDITIEDSTKLPLSGGNLTASLILNNNYGLLGKDTSGNQKNLIYVNSSNEASVGATTIPTLINSSIQPTWYDGTNTKTFSMTSDIPTKTLTSVTLSAASWSSSQSTITNSSILSTSTVSLVPNATNTTGTMYDAIAAGKLAGTVSAGQVVIKALGTAPTIDVTCDLLIEG
jgi:hypothetical protein